MKHNEGNVLFLILLAVALFAALSYAVTQSQSGGGSNISNENTALHASQIIQYASNIEHTIQRLRLSNGCKETQISFAADSDGDGVWFDTDDLYHNANAPSDLSCHVFHQNGGAVPFKSLETEWMDSDYSAEAHYGGYFFTSRVCVQNVGTSNGNCWNNGFADEELMLFGPYLTQALCIELNKKLGVNMTAGEPTEDAVVAYAVRFDGTYADANRTLNDANYIGKLSGCYKQFNASSSPAPLTYHYFHVLIPR